MKVDPLGPEQKDQLLNTDDSLLSSATLEIIDKLADASAELLLAGARLKLEKELGPAAEPMITAFKADTVMGQKVHEVQTNAVLDGEVYKQLRNQAKVKEFYKCFTEFLPVFTEWLEFLRGYGCSRTDIIKCIASGGNEVVIT